MLCIGNINVRFFYFITLRWELSERESVIVYILKKGYLIKLSDNSS